MGIGILFLSSCNVMKFVPEGKTLLDGNRVKIEGDVKIEDVKDQILLVPNRKMFLVVKFNLWAYYFGNKVFKKDSTKVKMFFIETVGEKPVYLDTVKVHYSEKNIEEFLNQKGYFDNTVSSKVVTVLKRSYVTYTIIPEKPYSVHSTAYNGSDVYLDRAANEFAKDNILKNGDKIDFDRIEAERDRLTTAFRNNGYFYFNKAFIKMILDTGGHDHGVDINVNIANPGEERNARPQTIQRVYVEMDFKQRWGRRDTLKYEKIAYLFNGYALKPNILDRSIRLRPGELFSQANLEASYNKLMGLGLFRIVNIRILPSGTDSTNKLLVFISLQPTSKHVFIWEPQAITTDKPNLTSQDNNPRNYGFANQFILNNKNVFKNAEDFNLKFRLAAETQFGGGVSVTLGNKEFRNIGNFESNFTFELLYPKLLFFSRIDKRPKLQKNRTSINLTFQNEINTNYSRRSIPLNLTYQTFYQTKKKLNFNIFYSPLQLSFNQGKLDSAFLADLDNPNDIVRLERTFRNYIIPAQKLAIVFSDKLKSPKDYWNIRYTPFELAGNIIEFTKRLIDPTASGVKEKSIFGFADIPYFQYFRTDVDVTHYNIIGENSSFVVRGNIGVGKAYGNSYIMPYERQFYVGGSNSLRAWRPRIIGPGESGDSLVSNVDKMGDLLFQSSAEYRFDIVPGFFEGAFFADAGNVWLLTKGSEFTTFNINTFYKQLAMNTGAGIRLNLSFFILRLDWGIPLHDPREVYGDRWVIKNFFDKGWIFDRTLLSLAIGFPF